MRNKVTLLNMISGLLLQLCTLINGFVIPKIILSYFGSEVNGLVSSLNQFLSYITLVEGGITGVIVANLYKPLVEKDNNKLSSVLVTSDKFYKKIGFLFVGYSVILGVLYPIIFKTEYSFAYVFSLTLILSMNLLIQYMFSLTLKSVLTADKKSYIVNFTQMAITITNIFLALFSVVIYPSIHVLKLISGCLFILQPVVFGKYINKNYQVDWNAKPDNSLIKERWSGFAINLAAFIHNSTDVSVLTIFTNFKTVSIYSVYCLVSNGLKQLINACTSGISATVGQAYARHDFNEVNKKMDLYEYIVFMLVFFLFTVAALLITPFVQIYTKDIADTNYYQPAFGILLLISEALYLIKLPHMNLSYSANKFKEITIPSFIEAGLNIIISVILVSKFGLIGVTIGTIVGMTFRTIFHVYFTSKLIPRPQIIFYKKFFLFSVSAVLGFLICYKLIPITNLSVLEWIIHAVIYSAIIGGIYFLISIVFFRSELKFFAKYLKR